MANLFGVAEHYAADLVGYSAQHELRLLVEVKAGRYWAAKDLATWTDEGWEDFFQEVTGAWFPSSNKPAPDPRTWTTPWYFMLVTPRQTALWQPGASHWRRPDYIVESSAVLARQLDTARFPLAQLDKWDLESVVQSWLTFSQLKTEPQLLEEAAQQWLVESGLYTAIFHGNIQRQTA